MEPNKSQIPSLKDTTKKPELKIKGMAVGMSLVDRVKSFRKKDLAFIGAGLAVLFLAPLVEHFMMAPDSGQGTAFQPGYDVRGSAGGGIFGKGGSPYEPGVGGGLAPGGLLGPGSEIITPLNVRDPSSLVMGPGQSGAQPVAASAPAPAAPAAKPASDWKDALSAAAGRGASAATKAASLPVPKVPLQGGLRGLGVLGGSGSGASWSGGPIAASGSSKPAGSNSLSNVKAATGYQGVAGKRGNSATGSIEDLKKAADKAASGFNAGGGAAGNLLTSSDASQAIPGGSSNGGAGGSAGDGAADKAGGQNHDMKGWQRGEQSLEYLMKKKEMENEMDLKWELKKKAAMFGPDLMRDVQKEFLMKGLVDPIAGGIGKGIEGMIGSMFDPDKASPAVWFCEGTVGHGHVPASYKIVGDGKCEKDAQNTLYSKGGNLYKCGNDSLYGEKCTPNKAADAGGANPAAGATPPPPTAESTDGSGTVLSVSLDNACKEFGKEKQAKEFALKMQEAAKHLVTANAYLQNGESLTSGNASCRGKQGDGADLKLDKDSSVRLIHAKIGTDLKESLKVMSAELAGAESDVMTKIDDKGGDFVTPFKDLGKVLDDAAACKDADEKDGKKGDCLQAKEKISADAKKVGADKQKDPYGFNDKATLLVETDGRGYKKFGAESVKAEEGRSPKGAKLIDDASKLNEREPVSPSQIYKAKVKIEYADQEIAAAEQIVKDSLGTVSAADRQNWGDFIKQVEGFRDGPLADVKKASGERQAVQGQLIDRTKDVNGMRDQVLTKVTGNSESYTANDPGVYTYVHWAIKIQDAGQNVGYGKDKQCGEGGKDCATLAAVLKKNIPTDIPAKVDGCVKAETPGTCQQAFKDAKKILDDSAAGLKKIRDYSTTRNKGLIESINQTDKDVDTALQAK